jgi:non-ribosomal peptide synthetase component F
MLALQNTPQREIDLGGVDVRSLEVESSTSKFDLAFVLGETEQGLQCALEYNTDLFEPATVARLMGHWQHLLEAIAADPEQHIDNLPLLTQWEHEQLWQWNETTCTFPQSLGLHELWEQQVTRTPDAIALVYADQQVTYLALNQRANQLAHMLQASGIRTEVRVGLSLERSVLLYIGLLAILKAGGVYVPLDPSYPMDRLSYMAEEARLSLLLTQQTLQRQIEFSSLPVLCLDLIFPELVHYPTNDLHLPTQPDQLVYIM